MVLDLTSSVPYSAFLLGSPYRLVIDLPEVAWSADGKRVATVPCMRQTPGVSYLRLSSPARETDPEGFAVRSVEVDVEP